MKCLPHLVDVAVLNFPPLLVFSFALVEGANKSSEQHFVSEWFYFAPFKQVLLEMARAYYRASPPCSTNLFLYLDTCLTHGLYNANFLSGSGNVCSKRLGSVERAGRKRGKGSAWESSSKIGLTQNYFLETPFWLETHVLYLYFH